MVVSPAFLPVTLAAAQTDGGDVFVVGIKANHVCAVARRERRGERRRFADGKRQLAWRDGNVRGAQQHLERFGRNGLAELMLLAVIFTWPGATGFSLPVAWPMEAMFLLLETHLTLVPATLSG